MKNGLRKNLKRVLATTLSVAVTATVLTGYQSSIAYAEEEQNQEQEQIQEEGQDQEQEQSEIQELVWIHPGNGWHYLKGTDISVGLDHTTAYIHGTGALPDFDYWKLYERPWANINVEKVYIADTITSIGKYAFYDLPDLNDIEMSTSTFIKDSTCFDKISYKPVFRLHNKDVNTEMIGTIPYTSLDSIKAIAQTNYNGASWVMDSPAKAKEFQNSTNPTIPNVYYAGEKVKRLPDEVTDIAPKDDVPWINVEIYGNGDVATPICRLSEETPDASLIVSAQKIYQGRACLEAYAAFIEDYTFAATFNVAVNKNARVVTRSYEVVVENKVVQTENELKYVLTIPQEFQLSGRTFRLLGIGEGVVNIYDDLDLDNSTITFATKTPTTAYALVYK